MAGDLSDGPVRVLHRTGQWCPGWRIGSCAAYDLPVLPEYRAPGQGADVDRCYLLLGQGIQLTQPSRYVGTDIDGWWYIDLVAVDETTEGLVVHDLYVDFLVPPAADRYDVLDLDDLAGALTSGAVSPAVCATTLRQAQTFLDRHLRDPRLREPAPREEFPPAPVRQLQLLPPFTDRGTDRS